MFINFLPTVATALGRSLGRQVEHCRYARSFVEVLSKTVESNLIVENGVESKCPLEQFRPFSTALDSIRPSSTILDCPRCHRLCWTNFNRSRLLLDPFLVHFLIPPFSLLPLSLLFRPNRQVLCKISPILLDLISWKAKGSIPTLKRVVDGPFCLPSPLLEAKGTVTTLNMIIV